MLTATFLSEVLNGQFWSLLSFPKMSSHIDLCAVEGMHGTIEKTIRANEEEHTNLFPQLAEFT
jgi:hypothetical protein